MPLTTLSHAPALITPKWPSFMTSAAQQNYLSAEAGLRAAQQEGYSHWYIDGSLEGERPTDFDSHRIQTLMQQVEESGIKPIYHGNFKAPLGSDVKALADAAFDYVTQEIDLCQALGSVPLIVHGGGVVEPRLVREARCIGLDNLVSNLQRLVAYGKERGVDIWLENLCNYTRFHPFYYICTTEEKIEAVLTAVPGLHLFLDVSHAHVNNGDPVSLFHKFNHRIKGMSFSDNKGDRDSHSPLGGGTLNYPDLLQAIEHLQWQGTIGFETRGATLSKSVDFLNDLTLQLAR